LWPPGAPPPPPDPGTGPTEVVDTLLTWSHHSDWM
jgi:hypothetical protein